MPTDPDAESWKQIPEFPNYEASNQGRFRRRTNQGNLHPLYGKLDRLGYHQVGLFRDGKQHWFLSHRLIASLFLNPAPQVNGYLTVNHKNRIRNDNRAENLELVTVSDNAKHWRRYKLDEMTRQKVGVL